MWLLVEKWHREVKQGALATVAEALVGGGELSISGNAGSDGAGGVNDGAVVPFEALADVGQGVLGQFPGDDHGDLAGDNVGLGADVGGHRGKRDVEVCANGALDGGDVGKTAFVGFHGFRVELAHDRLGGFHEGAELLAKEALVFLKGERFHVSSDADFQVS